MGSIMSYFFSKFGRNSVYKNTIIHFKSSETQYKYVSKQFWTQFVLKGFSRLGSCAVVRWESVNKLRVTSYYHVCSFKSVRRGPRLYVYTRCSSWSCTSSCVVLVAVKPEVVIVVVGLGDEKQRKKKETEVSKNRCSTTRDDDYDDTVIFSNGR